MNIFILSSDPIKAAKYHNNKHVVKMIVESAQMLANVFTLDELTSAPLTHKGLARDHSYLHHPCSKWVLEGYYNFLWLLRLTKSLCNEYTLRYNKSHFTENFIRWVDNNKLIVKNRLLLISTPPKLAIKDKKYHHLNAIIAYRQYYIGEKLRFSKYINREFPRWLKNGLQNL